MSRRGVRWRRSLGVKRECFAKSVGNNTHKDITAERVDQHVFGLPVDMRKQQSSWRLLHRRRLQIRQQHEVHSIAHARKQSNRSCTRVCGAAKRKLCERHHSSPMAICAATRDLRSPCGLEDRSNRNNDVRCFTAEEEGEARRMVHRIVCALTQRHIIERPQSQSTW